MPQTSIRFFMALIAASALVMYAYRAAFVGDQFWAKIAALLISTAIGCFVVYAVLFLVANLFTATTAPIRKALDTPSSADHESSSADHQSSSADYESSSADHESSPADRESSRGESEASSGES